MQGGPRFTVTRSASSPPRPPFGVRAPVPVRARFVVARRPLAPSVDDEHDVLVERVLLRADAAAELAPVDAPVVDADEHDVDAPRAVPPVDA